MKVNILYDLAKVYPEREIQGKYKSLDYHRNSNPEKAQWTIPVDDEIDCFANTKEENWIDEEHVRGWGIVTNEKGRKIIGYVRNKNENIDVYIARFVGNGSKDEWHGYPANVNRCAKDRPEVRVLKAWQSLGYISNSEFTRIRRGIL